MSELPSPPWRSLLTDPPGRGSEDGVIVRDWEHDRGARITLERDCRNAPFAITCGIYGLMVHTRFLGEEGPDEFVQMAADLARILDVDGGEQGSQAAHDFVTRYP